MRPSDADDVGQARSDGRVTQQEYLDSPCGFCGCRRGDHTSAQALDCYRDIAARQASEDGLPPEVECSVDGCTYRNRPMATMWAYHMEEAHADLMEWVPAKGLTVPDDDFEEALDERFGL